MPHGRALADSKISQSQPDEGDRASFAHRMCVQTGPVTARPTSITGGWVFQRARVIEPVGGALKALEDRPADAKTREPEFSELADEFKPCRSGPAVQR
jgi:hypothetical protein